MIRKSIKDIRKQEIFQSCYNVIKREGIENTTIAKISNEMGVAPSLLMHYFKNKDTMMVEFVNYMVDEMNKLLVPTYEGGKDNEEKLTRFLNHEVTPTVSPVVDERVFFACFYRSLFDERIKKRLQQGYDLYVKRIQELVEGVLKEKGLAGYDTEKIALFAVTVIEGLIYMHSVYSDSPKLNELDEKIRKIIMGTITNMDFMNILDVFKIRET